MNMSITLRSPGIRRQTTIVVPSVRRRAGALARSRLLYRFAVAKALICLDPPHSCLRSARGWM